MEVEILRHLNLEDAKKENGLNFFYFLIIFINSSSLIFVDIGMFNLLSVISIQKSFFSL